MNIDTSAIVLKPIGVVRSPLRSLEDYPEPGMPAWIEVLPQYREALQSIEANSHLWILLWFHKADRTLLKTVPRRFNPDLPEYGVFGLRSPNRPNPIALTLVQLEELENGIIRVQGLDAIDGTPVLDIKSYYEQDIVFSPKTPYIRSTDPVVRRNHFYKQALKHHQEACPDLFMAVRMVLVADQYLGHINRPDLRVTVKGSSCLADCIQGLSRARLANPSRFAWLQAPDLPACCWTDPGGMLTIHALCPLDEESFGNLGDADLFRVEFTRI